MRMLIKSLSLSFIALLTLTACNPAEMFVAERADELEPAEVRETSVEEGTCPLHPIVKEPSYVEEHKFSFDAPAKELCVARFGVTDTDMTFDEKIVAGRDRCIGGDPSDEYPRWIHYSAGNATAPAEASVKCVYLFEEPAAIYLDFVEIPQDSIDRARAEYAEYVDMVLTREGYEWSTASRDLTKELQSVLGITADGWYGNDTRAAHLAALEERPDLVHPPLPTADN